MVEEFPRNWAVRNLLMQLQGVELKTKVTRSLKLDLGLREKEILELCLGLAGRGPQTAGSWLPGSGQWTLLMAQTQIMVTGRGWKGAARGNAELQELVVGNFSSRPWLGSLSKAHTEVMGFFRVRIGKQSF